METKIPDEADLLNVAVRVAILINLTTKVQAIASFPKSNAFPGNVIKRPKCDSSADTALGGWDWIRLFCKQCNHEETCPSVLMDEYDSAYREDHPEPHPRGRTGTSESPKK